MFHLTAQGRALAGIGIVVSIIALMMMFCILFYLCLTNPNATGARDGDIEYAKARDHWYMKQQRRKADRRAYKEHKQLEKQRRKEAKRMARPDHRHNRCACNDSDTLEIPRNCQHYNSPHGDDVEFRRVTEGTYVNLDCLNSFTEDSNKSDHHYEAVPNQNDSIYEVYYTAPDRTQQFSESMQSDSSSIENHPNAPSKPERQNVSFEIGSPGGSTTMEPDYDNTSYIGPFEETAIEPELPAILSPPSNISNNFFRFPENLDSTQSDDSFDIIRNTIINHKLNATFDGYPTSHSNPAFSESSSCGASSLPR